MVYKLNDKYYIKVSGYLIEVIPSLNNDELDFKPTQNKIEITSSVSYKSVRLDEVKDELKSGNKKIPQLDKEEKLSERTHSKFRFNDRD